VVSGNDYRFSKQFQKTKMTTKYTEKEEKAVKNAGSVMLFIGAFTILVSTLSIWIKSLLVVITPVAILLGIAYIFAYYFVRKKNLTASISGLSLIVIDIILIGLVSLFAGGFFGIGALVIKFFFAAILFKGTKVLASKKTSIKLDLAKGIGIALAVYILVFFLTTTFIFIVPESESDCMYYSGEEYDVCMFSVGVRTRDLSICEKIDDVDIKFLCENIATHTQWVCEYPEFDSDMRQYCLALTSEAEQPKDCEKIADYELRNECVLLLS